MPNWDLELIAGIYATDDPQASFRELLDSGMSLHLLGSQEARNYWSYIHAHYTRPHSYGFVPSLAAMREAYPMMSLPAPSEVLSDLLLRVRQSHTKRSTDTFIEKYLEASSKDPIAASVTLEQSLRVLNATQTQQRDVSYKERAWFEIVEDLESLSANDGLTGLPYPWQVMNRATGGIQAGDIILMWGMPKSRKTWIGLYIAAFLFMAGYRVLVYSKEMMWKAIRRRLSCIIGRVDYERFKASELTPYEVYRYLDANRRITEGADESFRGELIFTDCDKPDGSPGGPSEVRQKIDTYKPDFVFLDSSYLLQVQGVKDEIDWKGVAALTRQLKQVGKSTGVPLLGVFQENEKAAIKYKGSRGTASIAMYAGIVADCDVGIRLVCNNPLDEVSLWFAACRETKFPGFTIKCSLAETFEFAHLNLHDIDVDSDPGGRAEGEPAPEPIQPPDFSNNPFINRYGAAATPSDPLGLAAEDASEALDAEVQ